MPSDQIQWFPGHMAKTRRLIKENLSSVDVVIELLDARVPMSSENPEFSSIVGDKPTLILMNKASLADPEQNKKWAEYFAYHGKRVIETDCITGAGLNKIMPILKEMLSDRLQRYSDKGMEGRKLRAMVLGIPNVGKSSLVNKLSGVKRARVEDRPGVTLTKQWVVTKVGLELLDMPGVLWPKFEDRAVGEKLAATGAIKDDILDTEAIAFSLVGRLRQMYPAMITERYKLDISSATDETISDYDFFLMIGKKRGFLVSGGEIDTERTALMILDEFRGGKIGRVTLDRPE
ncbi:MAG: ribosome biogenesis GTPase YlqF [Clostridia bacterium]|nr:ribosome biogenesis GTPase YlqF [Clostridia bacterium]